MAESTRKTSADDRVRYLLALREKAMFDEATRLYDAREEGRLEGRRSTILDVLAARFELPSNLEFRLSKVSVTKRLSELTVAAATVASLEDFLAELD